MEALGKKEAELVAEGKMLDSGGLSPTADGVRVRLAGGELTVTDGPFTEVKEVIGGYAIMEFPSRETAIESAQWFIEMHKQHWPGWEGECEVRQISGPEDFPRPE